MSKQDKTYINLVGGATVSPSKRKRKVVKAKSRRGGKAGTVKGRGSARATK
jgi:hypothetical protein